MSGVIVVAYVGTFYQSNIANTSDPPPALPPHLARPTMIPALPRHETGSRRAAAGLAPAEQIAKDEEAWRQM